MRSNSYFRLWLLFVGSPPIGDMGLLPALDADSFNLSFLEALESSILITDAASQQPIVYVNSAFENLTGYTKVEIISQNFRFLQGNDTDQGDLIRIRNALRKHQPVLDFLRNYRKNRELFYN
jgi:PAS domain S-box-containing protein